MQGETRSTRAGAVWRAAVCAVTATVAPAHLAQAQTPSATTTDPVPPASIAAPATPGQGEEDATAIARRYLSEVGEADQPGSAPADASPQQAATDKDTPISGSRAPILVDRTTRRLTAAAATPMDDSDETLQDAIRAVVETNPDVLEAQARRDEARFARGQAIAAYLPTVELTTSTGSEQTKPSKARSVNNDRVERQAVARQLLFDFGQTINDVRRANRVVRGADWGLRAAIETVSLDVANAYLGVLEKQQLLDLARENLAAHERILATVMAQRQFGLGSGADVSRVEARLNAAKSQILDRESDLAQAREAYRRQLDRLPGRLAPAPQAEPLLPADETETLEQAQIGNPELQQAAAQVEALRRQRASQLAAFLPRIELEAQRNYRKNAGGPNGTFDDERAMVVFRYKLFDGGAREASYGRIGARLRAAYSAQERVRRDIEQRVRSEFAALEAARDKVAAIDAEVAAGERLVELYAEQFRTGGRSVFDLLDGQETLIQAKGKRISNVAAREVSAYRVLASMGKLFETVTGSTFDVKASQAWWGQSADPRRTAATDALPAPDSGD